MENHNQYQYIPKDISRCNNEKCALKNDCKRYLQLQIDTEVVPVSHFNPGKKTCNAKL